MSYAVFFLSVEQRFLWDQFVPITSASLFIERQHQCDSNATGQNFSPSVYHHIRYFCRLSPSFLQILFRPAKFNLLVLVQPTFMAYCIFFPLSSDVFLSNF